MIKRFVKWYVRKFLNEDYVFKSDIGEVILKARREEQERLDIKYKNEIESIISQMNLDKDIACESLKANILQMEDDMVQMSQKVNNAKDVYFRSIQRAKTNARVAQDMGSQAKAILELVGQIYGSLEGIQKRAFLHLNKIEKEDALDRQKLKLPELTK